MYTLESLKSLNASFDSVHRLEQSDVEIVNSFALFIESMRAEKPCTGDIIEYTDAYGIYRQNGYIHSLNEETGQLSFCACPLVPYVYLNDDKQGVHIYTDGGYWGSVDSEAVKYIGKRERFFNAFGHCGATAHGAVCFRALVNVWEYIEPDQKHPGYSTKDWRIQYISYCEKPLDGSEYHYYGTFNSGLVFRNAAEFQRWKNTYKAVEFPSEEPNRTILFLYRKIDRLVSREEWDALDLPLDTRFVNGIIHVKVAYDDNAHIVTAYRFTNSGYLDRKTFGPYERAKGTKLIAPGPEVR